MTAPREMPPIQCLPPHGVTDPEKMYALANSFATRGWEGEPLIGYRIEDGRIQLLSGSHRWAAARLMRKRVIPVRVYPEWYVQALWDTPQWRTIAGRPSVA